MNAKLKAINRAIAILSEHFPSGRVFVESSEGPNESCLASEGWGSYYAQIGIVKDFMTKQDACGRMYEQPLEDDEPQGVGA